MLLATNCKVGGATLPLRLPCAHPTPAAVAHAMLLHVVILCSIRHASTARRSSDHPAMQGPRIHKLGAPGDMDRIAALGVDEALLLHT